MRTLLLTLLSVLFLFSLAACGGGGGGGGGSTDGFVANDGGGGTEPPPTDQDVVLAVLDLVNVERAAAGLSPLQIHEAASQVAFAHCVDMDVRDFWDHTNPDGEDPGDRLWEAGIICLGWGENIAVGYQSPEQVMAAWMNSDGHRQNILNASWTHVGIGVYAGTDTGPYWTQDFIRQP